MKLRLILKPAFSLVAVLISCSFFFQSCVPSNDIQPVSATPNTVTVKVKNEVDGNSFVEGHPYRHFRVTTTDQIQKVLLDTDITGSFTYNFKTLKAELNITATLTSASPFMSDLEIDVNGQMHSYHGGSCAGTEYDITDDISF